MTVPFEFEEKPLKLAEDLTLLKTERCFITASKDTLALPIIVDGKRRGFFFHGEGQLLVDTVIETSKGAVGKSTDEELQKPFIMLNGVEEVEEHLAEASLEDLRKWEYEGSEEFLREASDKCRLFLNGRNKLKLERTSPRIFAFTNDEERFNILVSEGEKLVFTSGSKTFVLKNDKSVLTCGREVVVSKPGKSVVISNGNIFVEKDS